MDVVFDAQGNFHEVYLYVRGRANRTIECLFRPLFTGGTNGGRFARNRTRPSVEVVHRPLISLTSPF
jgi:hypothetical protein